MADKDAATPRIFLIRHGETEWSRNGRYTGISDLPLLPEGEAKVRQTAAVVIGKGKLIDPARLVKVYCSPRQRAQRTLELLLTHSNKRSSTSNESPSTSSAEANIDIDVTENIREWTYGDYEGLRTHEILALRKSRGLDAADNHKWNIWTDGAEGPDAESPLDVSTRLDKIITDITRVHGEYLSSLKSDGPEGVARYGGKRDILVVAHGHILRAFVKRWLGLELGTQLELMLEPGGVCGLSYAHGKVDERAVLCGMSFPAGD